eukprot:m51a1_g2593 hypothetical protein (263) ;mRNA; f:437475-438478
MDIIDTRVPVPVSSAPPPPPSLPPPSVFPQLSPPAPPVLAPPPDLRPPQQLQHGSAVCSPARPAAFILTTRPETDAAPDSPPGRVVSAEELERMRELHRAAMDGNLRALRRALASGVGVDADDCSITALHRAAQMGRPEAVAALLRAGADVDRTDSAGRTPLHYALCEFTGKPDAIESMLQRRKEVVRVLMRAGASRSIRDRNGHTPEQAAEVAPRSDMYVRYMDLRELVEIVRNPDVGNTLSAPLLGEGESQSVCSCCTML